MKLIMIDSKEAISSESNN